MKVLLFVVALCQVLSQKSSNQFVLQTQDINNQLQFVSYFSQTDGYWTPLVQSLAHTSDSIDMLRCDWNGDNQTDVVQIWSQNRNTLAIASYLSSGTGTYTLVTDDVYPGTPSNNIIFLSGDVDGDKVGDLIQLYSNSRRVSVISYLSNGDGTFRTVTTNTPQSTEYLEVFVMDMNNDGFDDVVQTYNGGGIVNPKMTFITYISLGNGSFTPIQANFDSNTNYIKMFPIDLNTDKRMDILQVWDSKGEIGFIGYISQGNGNYTVVNTFYPVDSGSTAILPVDIDNDGKMDVLQISRRRGLQHTAFVSYISQNDGTFKFGESNYNEEPDNLVAFSMDIDGNGRPNDVLLIRNSGGSQMGFLSYYTRAPLTGLYKSQGTSYNITSKYVSIFPMIRKR